jgi:hypothetical protein
VEGFLPGRREICSDRDTFRDATTMAMPPTAVLFYPVSGKSANSSRSGAFAKEIMLHNI